MHIPDRLNDRLNPGAAVLDTARAHIARFVTMPSQAALDLTTVWVAHTHVVDRDERLAFDTSPRLAFVSDKPASGKTAALEECTRLSFHGGQVIDPTPASFALMVSEERASVMIDEIDVLFGAGAAKATLRSLLNAGYKKGAKWARANKAPVSVFSPVALAGLGAKFRTAVQLEPLRTRAVVIEMQPARAGEGYRMRDHDPMTHAVRDSLTVWAKRNHQRIVTGRPQDIPEGIENRLAEVCEPLFMVADAAGGHWPQSIRNAARELLLGQDDSADDDTMTLTDQLLTSLKAVFEDAGTDKMSTKGITDGMYADADANWGALWPNPNTASRELAAMLAPLGVEPVSVRFGDQVLRGYHRVSLEYLWDEMSDVAASAATDAATDAATFSDDDELIDA